jgi:hypothetical protein
MSAVNKRHSVRTRRLLQALCIFNNGSSSLDVTVRDISESGARLIADGLHFLPQTFELRIREADGRYSARRARLVWTKGRTAGLEFIA